jgi:diacylglycerol kinase family enzyme
MKHVFVFDPKAFFNQQWKMDNILDDIGQFFRVQDKPDFSIQFSRYRRNAITIIQEEAEKAKPGDEIRIYAVGGEGILFDCLNGVAHFPDMQLAAVPYGQNNDFLEIFGKNNVEAFKDIPSLVEGEAHPTDVIKWGVNYALNSCYIGMNSAISKRVKDLKSKLNKSSFIVFSKVSTFFNNISAVFDKQSAAREYKIIIDDQDYSGRYSLIHVANTPYHNGKLTGVSKAAPNDGILDVALIKSSHPLGTLWSMGRYSRGKRSRNCIYVQAKKISVQSNNQMWIQLDNEYIQDTGIELSLVHHAVKMVAVNYLSYPMASTPAL